METVIVFGSGGREYSLIKRLYDDSKKKNIDIKIICIQTNVNDKIREYASTIVTTLADNNNLNNIIEGLLNSYNEFLGIVGSEDFLAKKGGISYHPVGTCKMGDDKLAVVDYSLKVHGINSLRIADASIMPNIVSGNTNAPVIMIGEKAADIILKDI